jgi:hypothetical protein
MRSRNFRKFTDLTGRKLIYQTDFASAPIKYPNTRQNPAYAHAFRRNRSQFPCITFLISSSVYPRFFNSPGIF